MSLRKAVNEKCRDCIHDDLAPGTWLQQVILCSDESCPLWKLRPKSKSSIPESVLSSHVVKSGKSQDLAADLVQT